MSGSAAIISNASFPTVSTFQHSRLSAVVSTAVDTAAAVGLGANPAACDVKASAIPMSAIVRVFLAVV